MASEIDNALVNRLRSISEMILNDVEDYKGKSSSIIVGTLETRSIIKKWKYRTKNRRIAAKNSFLPNELRKLQPLYDNIMEIAIEEYKGVELYSLEQALERVRSIVEGTNGTMLAWDDVWINELSLASKGWQFNSLVGKSSSTLVLICCCCRCNAKIYLNLHPIDEPGSEMLHKLVNKKYWEQVVMGSRNSQCPWASNLFNLKNYYLRDSNLIHDIQRLQSHKNIEFTPENETSDNLQSYPRTNQLLKLSEYFQCGDKQKLQLLLRGYEPIHDCKGVVRCVRCFHKAFLRSIVGSEQLNCHSAWCAYHDESKLAKMLTQQLLRDRNVSDVKGRLIELEHYFETV